MQLARFSTQHSTDPHTLRSDKQTDSISDIESKPRRAMTYKLTIWAESKYNESAPTDIEFLEKRAEELARHLSLLAAKMPDFNLHFTVIDYDAKRD